MVPPLDRVDAAEDRLPVNERAIAARTPKLWWCSHGRRGGSGRLPSGAPRRRVDRASVRYGGPQGIGGRLLVGLWIAIACSHVGLKRVSAAPPFSPDAVPRSPRNTGSREAGRTGHSLAAWRPGTGSVKKSATIVCRVSDRRKGHSVTFCVLLCAHAFEPPVCYALNRATAWCATASNHTVS